MPSFNFCVSIDEAIAKFAAAHDLPLPSPPNFTRPLRTFAGMVTHWQIKAALRNVHHFTFKKCHFVCLTNVIFVIGHFALQQLSDGINEIMVVPEGG